MFVSLVLYKGVYLPHGISGDENELSILLLSLSFGSLVIYWDCLTL